MMRLIANLSRALLAAGVVAAMAPAACAQLATLDKGHQLLVNMGLQIWGCDTGGSDFNYGNLTGANMNGVMWSHGESEAHLLSTGQKWGKWVDYTASPNPATSLTSAEQARYADLVAIQVGDEQQSDIESPNSLTTTWFQNARNGNHFNDKLLYINSFYIGNDTSYANFIANANPDAISFDAYPFNNPYGQLIFPQNWLAKAGQFRRHALGSHLGLSNNAPRPYGLYLQSYESTSEGARHPGDLEMRWQQFSAWTMGFTFADAFSVGGATSLFNGGSMSSPSQPRYNQFKESARQSRNLGPALVRLISHGYGPSIVVGKDPNGAANPIPFDWLPFHQNNAPANQRYLTGVSAENMGTKNNGQPGDIYVGFFNPLHASFGDPAGTAYFMVTNGLGVYLNDPTLTPADTTQEITLDFNFGASGINSLQRLSRNTGQVEVLPLTHITGSQYRMIFDLEGGTGDLFKYNDGSPFVGIEQPMDFLYWDNDGVAAGNNIATGAGLGGSGTWNTSASKWFNGSTDGVWVPGKGAVLSGTAGTVTLAAPQSADSLWFKTNGYTVAGSTLTVTGSDINVDAGLTGTINSTLAGSAGIKKIGAGTLVLGNASNSHTGGTTVSAGALRVSNDLSLGPAPGAFTAGNIMLNGGALQFGGNVDINSNRGITLGAAGGAIDTQAFTNPNGYEADDGGFQGSGDLTKVGSGTFYAAAPSGGANTTWTGRLIIKEGTWKIRASDGLPYNVPLADGLQADQVMLDGGTWQIGADTWVPGQSLSVTNARRGITVAAGGGTIDTQDFNFTWAGPLAGSNLTSVLNKTGAGTLRFTGVSFASTYNGIFNINAGTLRLDNGNTMGSQASLSVAPGATLNVTGNQTVGSLAGGGSTTLSVGLNTGGNNKTTTYSGVISGPGGLTKTGAGIMTLTNANTYAGGTTVSAGTLRVNNSADSGTGAGAVNVNGGTLGGTGVISGPITVASGGRLAPGASAGTLTTTSSMTLSTGAILDYELANVTTLGGGINDLMVVTDNLTLGSALTLNVDAYAGDLANGTYKLITYSGDLFGNTAGWSVGSSNTSGSHGYSFSTATPGEIQLIVVDATPVWTGAVSISWDHGGNWGTNVEPSGLIDAVFPTPIPGTGATIALTSGENARTITFNDSYTLSGGDLNIAAASISVVSGKTATIGSVLNGSAGLTKSGAGTLVLSGANSYSGGTNVNAGTLRVAADGNLGNSGGGVIFGGGTLNATATFTSPRAVSVNSGGGTINNAGAVSTSLTGTVSGAAGNALTKSGSGTLVLAQATPRSGLASAWLGNITVSGGTLKVGNGGSTGFLPGYDPIAYAGLPPIVPTISLASGTTLEFNHAAGGATQDTTHAVVISGAGNVVISGAKPEIFVANNTYTGATTINSGSSLRIGWGGALNNGGLGATAIANSGALAFSNDHNTTFPGSISGAGTLLKEYAGTLTLTGAAAHTGGTTIATGTLEVGNGGATGSISGNVTNNATLAFNRSDSVTLAGIVSGTGVVAKRGAGTLILSGSNSYSGGTTVTAGALQVSSDANLGATPSSFTAGNIHLDGGTLRFGADVDISNNRGIALGAAGGTIDTQGFSNVAGYTQANGIQGSGDLTKLGSGMFYMNTPANALNTTWTGKLILKEGTWKIAERGGLPFNPPSGSGDPVIAGQITFDGGKLQIASSVASSSSGRRGISVAAGGGTIEVDARPSAFGWSGPLAGNFTSAVLTKKGAGTLQFNTNTVPAPSTYAGNLNVDEGTLVINGGAAMGDLAAVNLANAAGVQLTISGAAETIGSLSGGGVNGGNATLTTGLVAGGNNNSTVFNGLINGAGGLTKTGSGTLTLAPLTGGNTYAGGTTVAAGTLLVMNASGSGTGAGPVAVNAGAALGGVGAIQGNVASDGVLAPGVGVGTLRIDGNYTQTAGGSLEIELGSSGADKLDVAGSVTLDGVLQVKLAPGFTPTGDEEFDILNWFGVPNGWFADVDLDPLPDGLAWDDSQLATAGILSIEAAFAAADFNEDTDVDGEDLAYWAANFGLQATAEHADGDADGDQDVDGADFLLWQRQVGGAPSIAGAAAEIPEPSTVTLLILGAVAVRLWGRQIASQLPRER